MTNYEIKKATFDLYIAFVESLREGYTMNDTFKHVAEKLHFDANTAFAIGLSKCALKVVNETVIFHVAQIGTVRKAWGQMGDISAIEYKEPKAPKAPKMSKLENWLEELEKQGYDKKALDDALALLQKAGGKVSVRKVFDGKETKAA